VVIDWDYLNAAESAKVKTWKVVVPQGGAPVGGYYFQAISKDAPHPAAARLWQEFLYSDAGQNLWLGGGARPVRADAMAKAGTIDKAKFAALPPVTGTPVIPTNAQVAAEKVRPVEQKTRIVEGSGVLVIPEIGQRSVKSNLIAAHGPFLFNAVRFSALNRQRLEERQRFCTIAQLSRASLVTLD